MEDDFPRPLAFFFTFLLFIFIVSKLLKKPTKSKLPPGPAKLPFIGNLHLLISALPHHRLKYLAGKYGPIMHLQLGEISTVVISSPDAAKQVFKSHDLTFSGRPRLHAAKLITYNFRDIALSPYGDYWRQMRKICVQELLSPKRVQSFKPIREKEVSDLVALISSKQGLPVSLRELLYSLFLSILSKATVGGNCGHQDAFQQLLQEIPALFGGFSVVDVFPSVRLFHVVNEMRPEKKKLHRKVDEILEEIIRKHRDKKKLVEEQEEEDDLVDVLLNLQQQGDLEIPLTTDNIKALLLDLFTGGGETSSTTTEWALAEMVKNPEILLKAQAEVRDVFGKIGRVDESGLHELKYLDLIIKETFRLRPPAPLLVPRECTETCEVLGYEIPAKSRLIVNVWAIGRDPKHWSEPEKFYPERFIGIETDFKGNDFELIPFGTGRRICPGMSFAAINIALTLANLLFHFDWKAPEGMKLEELDMTEVFGAVMRRKSDLLLIPILHNPLPSESNN